MRWSVRFFLVRQRVAVASVAQFLEWVAATVDTLLHSNANAFSPRCLKADVESVVRDECLGASVLTLGQCSVVSL